MKKKHMHNNGQYIESYVICIAVPATSKSWPFVWPSHVKAKVESKSNTVCCACWPQRQQHRKRQYSIISIMFQGFLVNNPAVCKCVFFTIVSVFPGKIFGTFQLHENPPPFWRTLKRRRLKAVHRVETAEQGAGLRALLGCLVLEVRDYHFQGGDV